MVDKTIKKVSYLLSAFGTVFLAAVFLYWAVTGKYISGIGFYAAAASAALAGLIYLRFIPRWMDFWSIDKELFWETKETDMPKNIMFRIFFSFLAFSIATLLIIFFIRKANGYAYSFADSMLMWYETDAKHYIDIARDGYLSEGEWDRLVQLVFLPGYPVVIRLVSFFTGNCFVSGFIVSIISFCFSGCFLYKLLRLDYGHKDAVRALKYLCILPASFFFTGPMSESLFMLLCILCLYCIRTKRWFMGCLLGGYAAFTRSLGITLFVPLVIEAVREFIGNNGVQINRKDFIKKCIGILIIPFGFICYCIINYLVAGDFLKFMEYQSVHWGQNFGWFFNTARYQTDLIITNWNENFRIVAGLWMPNVVMFFMALVVVWFAVKSIRPSYSAWFIAYFIISMGATWLLSAPRYLAALIVIPIALAEITKNKKADTAGMCFCVICNIIYLYVFSVRWYVW